MTIGSDIPSDVWHCCRPQLPYSRPCPKCGATNPLLAVDRRIAAAALGSVCPVHGDYILPGIPCRHCSPTPAPQAPASEAKKDRLHA